MADNFYEDSHDLTHEDIEYFLERMGSGDVCVAGSREHRIMTAASAYPDEAYRLGRGL